MGSLHLTTLLAGPVEECLQLNLDLDVELAVGARWGLRAVDLGPGYRANGVVGEGDRVAWRVRLFGVLPVRHTSVIGPIERRPDGSAAFSDRRIAGTLSAYEHHHRLTPTPEGPSKRRGTLMQDDVTWRSPLGVLGRVVDVLFVGRTLRWLLTARAAEIQRRAQR